MNDKYDKEELLEKSLFSYIGYNHIENLSQELILNKEDIRDTKVPETLDSWFQDFNKKIKRQEKIGRYRKTFKNIFTKVAMIFLILAISLGVLTTTVEAFRVKVLNMIMETKEKYIGIRVTDDGVESSVNKDKIKGYYLPQYIPKGFTLDKIEALGKSRISRYLNNKGREIEFHQVPNGADFKLDSENAIRKDIEINGYPGMTLSKEGRHIVFWHNEDYSFVILTEIGLKELIAMAESLKLDK